MRPPGYAGEAGVRKVPARPVSFCWQKFLTFNQASGGSIPPRVTMRILQAIKVFYLLNIKVDFTEEDEDYLYRYYHASASGL